MLAPDTGLIEYVRRANAWRMENPIEYQRHAEELVRNRPVVVHTRRLEQLENAGYITDPEVRRGNPDQQGIQVTQYATATEAWINEPYPTTNLNAFQTTEAENQHFFRSIEGGYTAVKTMLEFYDIDMPQSIEGKKLLRKNIREFGHPCGEIAIW